MAEVELRLADAVDASQVLTLLKQLTQESDTFMVDTDLRQIDVATEARQIDLINQTKTNLLAVAEYDNQLIGIITVDQVNCVEGELGVAVLADFQHNGIGTALVDLAVDWFDSFSQLNELSLQVYETNTVAVNLYKRFDFEMINKQSKNEQVIFNMLRKKTSND